VSENNKITMFRHKKELHKIYKPDKYCDGGQDTEVIII